MSLAAGRISVLIHYDKAVPRTKGDPLTKAAYCARVGASHEPPLGVHSPPRYPIWRCRQPMCCSDRRRPACTNGYGSPPDDRRPAPTEDASACCSQAHQLDSLHSHDAIGLRPAAIVADAHADVAAEGAPHRKAQIARLEIAFLQMLKRIVRPVVGVAWQTHLAIFADDRIAVL
jgi:hypothetical protein